MRVNPAAVSPFGKAFADIFVDVYADFVPKVRTYVDDSHIPVVANRKVSLWELLAYPSWSLSPTQLELVRCCIAAYLNAKVYGSQYPVTEHEAISMWRHGRIDKYCPLEACTTTYWTAGQIIDYLKDTWS